MSLLAERSCGGGIVQACRARRWASCWRRHTLRIRWWRSPPPSPSFSWCARLLVAHYQHLCRLMKPVAARRDAIVCSLSEMQDMVQADSSGSREHLFNLQHLQAPCRLPCNAHVRHVPVGSRRLWAGRLLAQQAHLSDTGCRRRVMHFVAEKRITSGACWSYS